MNRKIELDNGHFLEKDLEIMIKNKIPFKLIAISIDNLNEIFNLVGHFYGDEIYQNIKNAFIKFYDDEKIKFYNSYGFKFEIIHKSKQLEEVEKWVRAFRQFFEENPITVKNITFYLQLSIGITMLKENELDNSDSLVREAYLAIEHKESEFKGYSVFRKEIKAVFLTTFLVSQVRNAIENNEFFIEYRPKYNMKTKK